MMDALRMVWIISRHYNTEERMMPLMELISIQICEKVAAKIDVRQMFRASNLLSAKQAPESNQGFVLTCLFFVMCEFAFLDFQDLQNEPKLVMAHLNSPTVLHRP